MDVRFAVQKFNAKTRLSDASFIFSPPSSSFIKVFDTIRNTSDNSPSAIKFNIYIHDSKTTQTRGPFTIANTVEPTDLMFAHLFPMYGALQPNEPRFLVLGWYLGYYRFLSIDLHSLSPAQPWAEFGLPTDMPLNERLAPSCRTQEANRKLVIAGVVSTVFGVTVIAIWIALRWRKRRLKVSKADQNSLVTTRGQERDLAGRTKVPQALILYDSRP